MTPDDAVQKINKLVAAFGGDLDWMDYCLSEMFNDEELSLNDRNFLDGYLFGAIQASTGLIDVERVPSIAAGFEEDSDKVSKVMYAVWHANTVEVIDHIVNLDQELPRSAKAYLKGFAFAVAAGRGGDT